LRDAALPLSAGYLAKSIPGPLVKVVNSKFIRHAVLRYEEVALKRHEAKAVDNANAVTLVSTTDAASLTQSLKSAMVKKVHVIAPPVDTHKPVVSPSRPLRFVFVGADSQLQNRLAIEYLVALWKRLGIKTELVIYGKMSGQYENVPNLRFAGFAKTLDEVYIDGSIALCPTFLRGGIKSKVIEAISYGCVPVGNDAAFEGLGFNDDALAMTERRLEQFVTDPELNLQVVVEAACRFAAYCDRNYSTRVFSRRWCELLSPALNVAQTESTVGREARHQPELAE
jgi:glycosyltransferase involved in cell wall biosynthesis